MGHCCDPERRPRLPVRPPLGATVKAKYVTPLPPGQRQRIIVGCGFTARLISTPTHGPTRGVSVAPGSKTGPNQPNGNPTEPQGHPADAQLSWPNEPNWRVQTTRQQHHDHSHRGLVGGGTLPRPPSRSAEPSVARVAKLATGHKRRFIRTAGQRHVCPSLVLRDRFHVRPPGRSSPLTVDGNGPTHLRSGPPWRRT